MSAVSKSASVSTCQLSRRQALRALMFAGGAVASGGLLAACSDPTSEDSRTVAPDESSSSTHAAESHGEIRVGYLPITDAAPLLIAHARGLFVDHGIDTPEPVLFRSWANLVEAFQAQQVDVVHLLMPLAVQLRFDAELPVKVLTWNHTNGSALTVHPEVSRVGDLAGATVAIPFWFSIHNVVLQQLLRSEGLTAIIDGQPSVDERTVKLVVMAPPDMPPALAAGAIAGFIVADPFNALAETSGVGKVLRFTGDVWADHACCVTVVNEDLVVERHAAATALVDALCDAQLVLRSDRTGSARILTEAGYLPQPIEAIERALTHYELEEYGRTGAIQHPDWMGDRIGFQPYPFPSYTRRLIEELRETVIDGETEFLDRIDLTEAHRQLVATGLAESSMRRTGGIAAFDLESLTRDELISP